VSNLPVEQRYDLVPVCPWCEKEMHRLLARNLTSSLLSRRTVYCCPHCRKAIGISHRKGFLAS